MYVSIYRYDHGKIKAKTAEISFWNEEGKVKAVKKKVRPIIKIWETCDTDISFKPLK